MTSDTLCNIMVASNAKVFAIGSGGETMENEKQLKRYQFRIKFRKMNYSLDTPEYEEVFTFLDYSLDDARKQLDYCLNQAELFLTAMVRVVIMGVRLDSCLKN